MKNIVTVLYGLAVISFFAACSKSSGVATIDKEKKAIVSTSGNAFKQVTVTGAGRTVTFKGYDNNDKNAVIYFNRANPGFMTTEGFGLNKNYVLRLEPNKKYTVYIYDKPTDQTAYPLYFKTDFNGNMIDDEDKE